MKLKWNLKRITGLIAMLYGLCTLLFAGYGYYLQHYWYRQESRNMGRPEADVAQLINSGGNPSDLELALKRMTDRMGWIDGFVTPVESESPPEQPPEHVPIIAGSNKSLDGQDGWVLKSWYKEDWVGRIDQTFAGPDGKWYAVWAVRDPVNLPWPGILEMAQIAAVAAWLAVATWLYFDAAERESAKAFGWLVLGLLGGPVGLAVWLITRPSQPTTTPAAPPVVSEAASPAEIPAPAAEEAPAPAAQPASDRTICPDCGGDSPAGSAFCVRCGHPLHAVCPQCRRPVELDWAYCGACGTDLAE
ncbi:MAG: zinc ribbon domain-containing protein [Mycobacterium leprae]